MTGNCYLCGGTMCWGGAHTFEDYGRPGEGVVHNLSCLACGALVLLYESHGDDE